MAYSIDWVDCELTLPNIWHNIESIDPLNRLELMTMFTHSYYKFYENKISPAILETELRSRNLNVGLIAVDWTKDPYYKKIIEDKTGEKKSANRTFFEPVRKARFALFSNRLILKN